MGLAMVVDSLEDRFLISGSFARGLGAAEGAPKNDMSVETFEDEDAVVAASFLAALLVALTAEPSSTLRFLRAASQLWLYGK